MTNKEIKGVVIATQDQANSLQIWIDTTTNGIKSQMQIITTRHEDLQEIKRGDQIKITISHDS